MDIPKFQSFSSSLHSSVLKKTGNTLSECKIQVLCNEDLAWPIVLSYLLYRKSETSTIEEFQRRVSLLMDCNEDFLKNVERIVLDFNPFQSRYSCCRDNCLKDVVASFTEKLQWNSLPIRGKLQAASDWLQCTIVKITMDVDSEIEFIFPRIKDVKCQNITIFQEDKEMSKFSFGIPKLIGLELQKQAFNQALKHAAIPWKIIRKFHKIISSEDPFIIAVLNSKFKRYIPRLYKSLYALHKLDKAGFATDPTVEDDKGYPALFYALNDFSIAYSLFFHVCNACHKSPNSTYREPDAHVVTSLDKMSSVLINLRNKLDESQISHLEKQIVMSKIGDLSLLNQFLINVSTGIYRIKKENDSRPPELLEASKRKDILMCILNTYEQFFISSEVPTSISALDDYKQKKVFYKMMDSICAMLFFDNIFLLKERLKMEDENSYSAVESFFYLTVGFVFMIFPHFKALYRLTNKEDAADNFSLVCVFIRMAFKEKIVHFRNKLRESNIEKDKILKCVPGNEIFRTFHDFHEMKDEILIRKLRFYIDTALGATVDDMKSVLAIERALQVIGEDVIFSNQPKSFRRLLALSITTEQNATLKQLRNEICHLEKSFYSLKINAEKNFSLFSDMQREILNLKEAFLPVIQLQDYRVTHCVINFVGSLINEAFLSKTENTVLHGVNLNELSDWWSKIVLKSNKLWKKKLQLNIKRHLKKYKLIFANIFQYMEDTIRDDSFWKSKESTEVEKIDFVAKAKEVAWPVQFMLSIFKETTKFNIPENVIEMCEEDWLNDICPNEVEAKNKIKELLIGARNFASFFDFPDVIKKDKENFPIANIEKFKKTLKGSVFLSEVEKSQIRSEIPPLARVAKQTILQSIGTGKLIKKDERDAYFNYLILSNKKRNVLRKKYDTDLEKAKSIVEASEDPIEELENVLSENSVKREMFTRLCDMMHFSDESISLLSNLVEGQKKENTNVNNLSVVLDRIYILRNILIEECAETRKLWNGAKSVKSKENAVHKITQRFMQDPQIQASSEMLLFDCMYLIGPTERGSKDKKKLWIKTSKLYNGISLRNALAHGSPMLENIGLLLDVKDVPSALVKKMLQLVDDEPILKSMFETGLDFCMFHKMMNGDDEEYNKLRSSIPKCEEEKWKSYSHLIPEEHSNQFQEQRRESLKSISDQEEI